MITNLRVERDRLNMTQPEVAEKLGVGIATYVRWEKNGKPIPSDKLNELAQIGFDILFVVNGTKSATDTQCYSEEDFSKAIQSFLFNTAELGLLIKADNANVDDLVKMALYSLKKEAGKARDTEVTEKKTIVK
ncbi:hypothetical protein N473_07025 [Pseudoalteromonas luteoviolacea CPMOR-1]|uniref:HTH cro/C1-type domain-containing protein n=1 Tax=Pseudoalteromonas luteoviolacea CPMOR-1 TaxID=1365248 RepID=A0A167H4F3_9GAMM|nr:helix-turn-helix transcriptional regulator [Pseudoalteromonas luteoviolacea]KZN57621.1 hypothetical protein N473_07025 [Pseudoalteromonas luteoviolacea CPMOR-1]